MAAFRMNKLAFRKVAGSDARYDKQSFRSPVSTHDRAGIVGHAMAGQRVLRVLVIDDEQDKADALARLVCGWGYAARTACNDRAALRVAACQHPDVVLLDIEMPLNSGHQLAQQLRLDFPRSECLIIAVTSAADRLLRQKCSESDIDLVLIKPVDPSVLETLLMLECGCMNRSRTVVAKQKV